MKALALACLLMLGCVSKDVYLEALAERDDADRQRVMAIEQLRAHHAKPVNPFDDRAPGEPPPAYSDSLFPKGGE